MNPYYCRNVKCFIFKTLPAWEYSALSSVSVVPCWVCWPWSQERPDRCWEYPPRRTPDPPGAWWPLWMDTQKRHAKHLQHTGLPRYELEIHNTAPLCILYLLSFCVMVPFSSFPAIEASTLLASLAKSRSLTSAGETGTIAKASLSSFSAEVPIFKRRRDVPLCQNNVRYFRVFWNGLLVQNKWQGTYSVLKHFHDFTAGGRSLFYPLQFS